MINCIAVDDEPLALELLEDFISKVPFLKLARKCSNAFEALQALRSSKIDLIFLDIQMPDLTGLQLLKSLEHSPKVIFTTAYPEHAIEGFNLDAIDYLLKPFSFERFMKAVNKAYQHIHLSRAIVPESIDDNDYIFIKSGYDKVKLHFRDIQYIEGLKDYIQVYTREGKIISLMSMKGILEQLPAGEFVRIHRSYIVPLSKIKVIQSRKVTVNGKELPIGDMYKENFLLQVKQKKTQK